MITVTVKVMVAVVHLGSRARLALMSQAGDRRGDISPHQRHVRVRD